MVTETAPTKTNKYECTNWSGTSGWQIRIHYPLAAHCSQLRMCYCWLPTAIAHRWLESASWKMTVCSSLCISWKYQSMHMYLNNNHAKFHPNPIWYDGALGIFLNSISQKNNKNKISSNMGSVPDLKTAISLRYELFTDTNKNYQVQFYKKKLLIVTIIITQQNFLLSGYQNSYKKNVITTK